MLVVTEPRAQAPLSTVVGRALTTSLGVILHGTIAGKQYTKNVTRPKRLKNALKECGFDSFSNNRCLSDFGIRGGNNIPRTMFQGMGVEHLAFHAELTPQTGLTCDVPDRRALRATGSPLTVQIGAATRIPAGKRCSTPSSKTSARRVLRGDGNGKDRGRQLRR